MKGEKNVKIYANLDCEQSLPFPRVVRVARGEGRARAVSGEAARSAGAEEKEKPLPIPSSFLSLIYIIYTVPRAEDFRNKNRLLVV